ncbi:MAG: MFS transporter [Terrimicrobiaceae bacterium]|nr:MFS transporter [Terrimicrobiaceae bacterium]
MADSGQHANPPPEAVEQLADHDAPRKEVLLYAVGNVEGGLANQFFSILNTLTVVVLGMNPLIIGFIISIKTFWDAITDPVMAQITDNARTRWGRRIPFILTGGLSRVLLLLAVFLFFPRDPSIKTNEQFKMEKEARSEQARLEREAGGEGRKPAPPPPTTHKKNAGIGEQFAAFGRFFVAPENEYHRRVAIYLLVASLLFALLSTVQSVPYYALGIELCPSYNGRTRVVVARGYVDKAMSLVSPWVTPFIFLTIFATAIDGLIWYAVFVCAIGIPTTVAMCMGIKERGYHPGIKRQPAPPLFKSIWITAKNPHFLKILFLYVFIGFTHGIFVQLGAFIVLFWVFSGDIVQGGIVNGYASTLAVLLGFATLPLIQWACNRFGKHRALRWAIVWMSIGTALKWVFYNPQYPYLQLLLPFFFSVGIGSVYSVLPSMMADVTDVDELNTGVRREGMFGAVMAFLMKAIGSVQPVLAAAVLVLSGFDASLGADQPPEVFIRMRVLDAFVPAVLLLLALVALVRYPLTRERMEQIKAELALRRARAAAAG